MMRLCSMLVCLLLAAPGWANQSVEAVGLFKDRALLRVLGQDRYVRVGEVTPEGAKLIAADADRAVVEFRGETYQLSLSERVSGSFARAEQASVSITSDRFGQYRVGGTINGSYVDFLVDTGASVIAISSNKARALGIEYITSDERALVTTAQGEAISYIVALAEVEVGGIRAHNVRAAVIEGGYPVDVLLGMSYLQHVDLRESAGVLRLERKY
jgi:aspartyl protease family protein